METPIKRPILHTSGKKKRKTDRAFSESVHNPKPPNPSKRRPFVVLVLNQPRNRHSDKKPKKRPKRFRFHTDRKTDRYSDKKKKRKNGRIVFVFGSHHWLCVVVLRGAVLWVFSPATDKCRLIIEQDCDCSGAQQLAGGVCGVVLDRWVSFDVITWYY